MATDNDPIVTIRVPYDDRPELARRLLKAAGDQPERVQSVSDGFQVPQSIVDAAGLDTTDTTQDAASEPSSSSTSGTSSTSSGNSSSSSTGGSGGGSKSRSKK